MATKAPMKRTPKKAINLEKLDDFASKANGGPEKIAQKEPEKKAKRTEVSKPQKTGLFPWEEKGVSDKVPKPFNLRTNQVEIAKLKFVVDNTPGFKSVHAFCMDAVLKAMDKRLKKLVG